MWHCVVEIANLHPSIAEVKKKGAIPVSCSDNCSNCKIISENRISGRFLQWSNSSMNWLGYGVVGKVGNCNHVYSNTQVPMSAV
jgi:hypothetical protein